MKPLPDIDENYTFFQNMRFFVTVLGMYIILGPFMLVDCFRSKARANCPSGTAENAEGECCG